MSKSLISLPSTDGWCIRWETGKTIKYKNGKTRSETKSFESTSKAAVEAKIKELEEQGLKVLEITECIF